MYLKHFINFQVPSFAAPHSVFGGKDACVRNEKDEIAHEEELRSLSVAEQAENTSLISVIKAWDGYVHAIRMRYSRAYPEVLTCRSY